MIIRFHPQALQELREAEWYIEGRRPRWGGKFRAEVEATLNFILDRTSQSVAYRQKSSGSEKVERFPYRLYYRIVGDEIRIRAVYHNKRKHGGWKRRRFT